jgi:hypothetical protein
MEDQIAVAGAAYSFLAIPTTFELIETRRQNDRCGLNGGLFKGQFAEDLQNLSVIF